MGGLLSAAPARARTNERSPATDRLGASAADEGKEATHSSPLPIYTAQGGLLQAPVMPHNRPPQARTYGKGSDEMHVLFSTYGSHWDVEPMIELAVQLRTLGAEVRV